MNCTSYIVLFILITSVKSAKILMLMHLQGSHVSEMSTIGHEMANRGHEVYTILPQTSRYISSLTKKGVIVLTFASNENDLFLESKEYIDVSSKLVAEQNIQRDTELTIEATNRHCRMILEDKNLIRKISDLSFNIALMDSFVLNYCFYIIPYMIKVPTVSIFSLMSYWDLGVPALPSFVPTVLHEASDKMTFTQKLKAGFYHMMLTTDRLRKEKDLLLKYVPNVPSWNHFLRETQLFIQLRDELLEWPAPRMPNTIYLPGITYKPAEPLPRNLENIYLKSKKGVIVMSFGSTAGFLPLEILQKFLTAFSKLKMYEIIWKFPAEGQLKDVHVPSNVHMLEWLPQNDCLGYEKTVLFITHCGNNGEYESLYHGIPMLGFPLFAEQSHNAFRIVNNGFGLSLDIFTFETEDLKSAISSILHNETIYEKVKKYSAILKGRQHPKYEAAYWIEHVMKFGGAHLRGASMDMPWYQLLMIDILIFLLIIFMISIVSCYCFCKCVFQQCRSKVKTD